ncbi:MAG: DNA repair protein RadC [Clostridia bacterium]|nr:DNA repair protein RadC [Clostridia bacterium]
MKVKEYAFEDRPYEKLERLGAEALSDSELIAIILKTGTKNYPVTEVAKNLISKDKDNIGISFLSQYSINELMKIPGVGRVKAITLLAVVEIARRVNYNIPSNNMSINTPEMLANVFMKDLHSKKQEIVETAVFDVKNRVKKVIVNSIGTINSNSISFKDILSEPIKMGASKIAISHNHPSGDVFPSNEDVAFTNGLKDACKLLGIEIIDHIIIGDNQFYSFKKNRLL